MTGEQNKKPNQFPWIIIFLAVAAAVWGWLIFKNHRLPENVPTALVEHEHSSPANTSSQGVTIADVIKKARGWSPIAQSWYGKEYPNIKLWDIEGTKHSLTDYRGKSVIVVFWATWCPPCKMEIPHLIATKNRMGDKLAILAVTNEEDIRAIKNFVAEMNINYTVLTTQNVFPAPFSLVQYLPSAFFITPEGKIKVATEGVLEMGDIKAILNAVEK
ncbi:MAG: TlpA family protein disulfide reductase [Phycisphaerae bacterium]|nr:TlpA family protein disulfide reductase [Phycisphaerae bacterium]